jgi:pyruvate dehydrogenase E2 component (dihydrolipoamide acetyltransferase)
MATDVFIPKMTDFMEEGTIVSWLVAEGDHVEAGQPILEIETDKATAEMEAPAAGFLAGIRPGVAVGAVVPVGETIAYIIDTLDEAVVPLPPL